MSEHGTDDAKIVLHRDGTFTVNSAFMGNWKRITYGSITWWGRCHCSFVIDGYFRQGFVRHISEHMGQAHPAALIGSEEEEKSE